MTATESVLFLDMDGVLNRLEFNEAAGSHGTNPENVAHLNEVLSRIPECRLVISSSWRYMVLNASMTLKGFEYLLQTHGVYATQRVIDVTVADEVTPLRGDQIRAWVEQHSPRRWAAVDDSPCSSLIALAPRFVMTDPLNGLTSADAERLIGLLSDAEGDRDEQ